MPWRAQGLTLILYSCVGRAYYKYNSALIEPWDGPALIAFTNGEVRPAPSCPPPSPRLPLRPPRPGDTRECGGPSPAGSG